MDKKVVIIPTYNEKENIENIIRAVFALEGDFHILVIIFQNSQISNKKAAIMTSLLLLFYCSGFSFALTSSNSSASI